MVHDDYRDRDLAKTIDVPCIQPSQRFQSDQVFRETPCKNYPQDWPELLFKLELDRFLLQSSAITHDTQIPHMLASMYQ